MINAWIINSCDNAWIINSFYFEYRSPIRSDLETTLSIRSEMYIFVPKSERIRSDRICTPLLILGQIGQKYPSWSGWDQAFTWKMLSHLTEVPPSARLEISRNQSNQLSYKCQPQRLERCTGIAWPLVRFLPEYLVWHFSQPFLVTCMHAVGIKCIYIVTWIIHIF